MLATYHNHTSWSDGKNSVAEMFNAASNAGVSELGISDHFCIFPDGSTRPWSMDPSKVDEYISELHSYQDGHSHSVRIGLEVDWFTDHSSILRPLLEELELDFRIGSLHHVDEAPFDDCFSQERSEEERLENWRKYWTLERNMAESGLFDMVAHIDMPKRLGFFPEEELEKEINDALDAFAANNVVVELNTAGYSLPCREAYASPSILQKCRERSISVTLSADGHETARIHYEFERGIGVLKEAGFRKIARFREREISLEPIEEALEKTD